LQPAEGAPVQIGAEPFLQITERILIHRVDVIDAAQFFHPEIAAPGTTAGSPEKKQKPLVPSLAGAALPALEDSVIRKLLPECAGNANHVAPTTSTIPHVCYTIPEPPAISYQLFSLSLRRLSGLEAAPSLLTAANSRENDNSRPPAFSNQTKLIARTNRRTVPGLWPEPLKADS
jgi:hypothetical protein